MVLYQRNNVVDGLCPRQERRLRRRCKLDDRAVVSAKRERVWGSLALKHLWSGSRGGNLDDVSGVQQLRPRNGALRVDADLGTEAGERNGVRGRGDGKGSAGDGGDGYDGGGGGGGRGGGSG